MVNPDFQQGSGRLFMDVGGPLTGIKVLDLSEDIAGSFCARLLADYGADVLKVEPPAGSAMRRVGPFYHDEPHPEKSLF